MGKKRLSQLASIALMAVVTPAAIATLFNLYGQTSSPLLVGTLIAPGTLSADDYYATQCAQATAGAGRYTMMWDLFGTPTPNPQMTDTPTPIATPLNLVGNAENGRALFYGAGACDACHLTEDNIALVGPPLIGIAERAGQRIPGLDARDYLRASILQPDEYIVPGLPSGIMPRSYAQKLTPTQIEDLVAYLLGL